MMTTLKCVKCDRTAQVKEQITKWTPKGHLNIKLVYERVCPCGGEIKVMME